MVPSKRRQSGGDSTMTAKPAKSSASAFYENAANWDLEQDYETRPRKKSKKEKEIGRLPIKTADGAIQHHVAPAGETTGDDDNSDMDWLEEDGSDEEAPEPVEEKPTKPVRQQILEAKEELAKIATALNEEPEENPSAFRAMAEIAASSNTTIKKLAIATQLAVYKDVIPGYRIRPMSEADMQVKVSKDVKKLRAFEQSLVKGYQSYLEELARLAKTGRNKDPTLASLAISCTCGLLEAVPHFNFRNDLLKIVVGKLSLRKVDESFVKCRDALEKLFQEDEEGTASLNAVQLLTKMMKQREYRVDESVLNTFLHLRLLSEFSGKASYDSVEKTDENSGKKLKQKREFRTKKQRKVLKEQKAIEKEMSQADAVVSREERDRMQAETLKLVFVAYFRILKMRTPHLMGAVLEGLARYAHLINQQFFGDILEALKDLIRHAQEDEEEDDEDEEDSETNRNLSREALLCVITAFALLEGQDAHKAQNTLHLDLSFFIAHLYHSLFASALNPDLELSSKSLHLRDPNDVSDSRTAPAFGNKVNFQTTAVLLIRSLSSVLIPPQAARAVPPLRIAAFTKQLMTASLQLPEKSSIAMLGLLTKVAKIQQKKITSLWFTEERKGDGRFNPLHTELEGSNPYATTIWEGELLRKHFSPAVREGVTSIEKNILGSN